MHLLAKVSQSDIIQIAGRDRGRKPNLLLTRVITTGRVSHKRVYHSSDDVNATTGVIICGTTVMASRQAKSSALPQTLVGTASWPEVLVVVNHYYYYYERVY